MTRRPTQARLVLWTMLLALIVSACIAAWGATVKLVEGI